MDAKEGAATTFEIGEQILERCKGNPAEAYTLALCVFHYVREATKVSIKEAGQNVLEEGWPGNDDVIRTMRIDSVSH